MRINVEVDFDQPKEHLEDMQKRIRNGFEPVWGWAKDELKSSFAENFTSNGLPVGGWAPLSAEYGAWKISRFPGRPTMVRSGRLFKSLSTLDNQRVNRISRHSARFGTGIPYAKFHQEGTSRMPKRQLVFIPEKFEHDISDKISDYINNGRI